MVGPPGAVQLPQSVTPAGNEPIASSLKFSVDIGTEHIERELLDRLVGDVAVDAVFIDLAEVADDASSRSGLNADTMRSV